MGAHKQVAANCDDDVGDDGDGDGNYLQRRYTEKGREIGLVWGAVGKLARVAQHFCTIVSPPCQT